MIHLDYRDARPIYSQIIDGLREQVVAGILREGDKLPSVRELAGELAINPNTIQRAYRELEAAGWIAWPVLCGIPKSTGQVASLLETFDKTVSALLLLGVTRQELSARVLGRESECLS